MTPIMPSFFRFLRVSVLAIAGIIAALWMLATFVEPQPRPVSVTIPVGVSIP